MKIISKYLAILILIAMLGCRNTKEPEAIKVPTKVGNLKTGVIKISANALRSNTIPDSIFKYSDLRELSIQGNDCDLAGSECYTLSAIPKEIGKLTKLEVLDLPVNGISKLPKEMENLQNLKVLSLIDNPGLRDLAVITKLEKLESLYLFGCNLNKLPKGMAKLKSLKAIYLTGNNFDEEEQKRIAAELPQGCVIHFDTDYQVMVK